MLLHDGMGVECSKWDDIVDESNVIWYLFIDGEVDKDERRDTQNYDKRMMTTWNEEETLDEVIYYCQSCAIHPNVDIEWTCIFHFVNEIDEQTVLQKFNIEVE